MRYLNIFSGILICSLILINSAFAEPVNVVDIGKVVQNYSKAQEAKADLKIKEDEIQKLLEDAKTTLKSAKSLDEQKKLKDKYNKNLKLKKDSYLKTKTQLVENIQLNISKAIEVVAKKNKIDTIFKKENILYGGQDFSEQVISELDLMNQCYQD